VSWASVIFQALAATAVWGILMTVFFGWPRDTILVPMVMFGLLMFAVLGTKKMILERRRGK
jgi:hypothetical protein